MLTRVFKKITLRAGPSRPTPSSPWITPSQSPLLMTGRFQPGQGLCLLYGGNGIIQGSGGKFMPKASTEAEEAQATREQTLIIAVPDTVKDGRGMAVVLN